MGYQVLARKYRPQRFADVAGQDHVTRTLTNALTQNRIAHGYIFSGHRGIGKTTIARILAMALNCRKDIGSPERPTVEPCLKCDNCREISAASRSDISSMDDGHSFDVEEIDAATNRGIDDARMLSSKIQARPLKSKYRIIIMDEAHQITDAAWNSLLKTLEEPPAWVIFMFATTQPEDIPQTIRSRCQHFSFHAVKFDDILGQLRTIATEEQVSADDAALALLAEAGDGSMRDALSIMDQAIASAPLEDGRAILQTDQIRELMGSVPNAVFERLMESVSAGQSAALMNDLDKLIGSGNSPAALARQMVRYLRNCLMAKIGGAQTQLLEIAQDERARAARTAQLFSEEDLTRNLQISLRTFDELNYRQEQRFHLELGLLKLIQAQRLLPMEEILSGLASQANSSGTKRLPAAGSPTPALRQSSAALPASSSRITAPTTAPSLSPFAASTQRHSEPPESRPLVRPSQTSEPQQKVDQGSILSSKPEDSTKLPVTEVSSAGLTPLFETAAITHHATDGSLALAELTDVAHAQAAPGPELLPDLTSQHSNSDSNATIRIREAVVQALATGGHATAAAMTEDATWIVEGSSVRIEVNAKPTMIRLTFNAGAEKLIRQALSQVEAPSRFMIVPSNGIAGSNAPNKSRGQLRSAAGSIEAEARSHPLVVQAQAIFNAEICSVVDLREK